MIHTYNKVGMHCRSCFEKVTNALRSTDGVTTADVTLDPLQARDTLAILAFGRNSFVPCVCSSTQQQTEPQIAQQLSGVRSNWALLNVVVQGYDEWTCCQEYRKNLENAVKYLVELSDPSN